MAEMKISIVVPVYNVEKYLRKCLDSLVNQTLRELEVIVVNDGTKDNSQEIIDEFVAAYPGRVRSYIKENGGLSDARNFGLKFCQGEYVGFIDSDDYVELDMFESMYEVAIRDEADVVACDYLKEYTDSCVVVKARKYQSSKDMFFGGLAAAWNKIYKRELLDRERIMFPKGLIYEDTEFFCKLIPYIQKCGYVNKPFVHYVQREGSIANSQGTKVGMIFEIFDNIYSYYVSNGFYKEYKDELDYFTIRILLGSSLERICRCQNRDVRNELMHRTMEYIKKHDLYPYRNKYLLNIREFRNIYMLMINRLTIKPMALLLRLHFARVDKKLK